MKRRGRVRWVVQVTAGALHAGAWERGAPVWAASASYAESAQLPDALRALLAGADPRLRSGPVCVDAARPLAQCRRLADLPPVRRQRLVQLIQAAESRLFRRNGTPLVVAAAWEPGTGPRVAIAAAMDLTLLDGIASALAEAGLEPVEVRPMDAPTLRLDPPARRAARGAALRRSTRQWALGALLAWGGVAGAGLLRLEAERRHVLAELTRLEAPAAAVAAARTALRDAEQMVRTIDLAQRHEGDLRRRLTAVAAALPDSVVLAALALGPGGTGSLSGYAPRASALLAALGRMSEGAAPRLDGRPVREVRWGREWERFALTFGGPDSGSTSHGTR